MEHTNDHERAAIARLAAAYGNTDDGRDTMATHVDLDRLDALCRKAGLRGPADMKVRPGISQVEATITCPPLRRSITCTVPIGEATLPPTRQTMRITAGDRLGPRISGLEAADYLAAESGQTAAVLGEVRSQLTSAAAALYRSGERLREDQQRTQRVPDEVWIPSPEAIDALSELLEQDARWKATMLVNDWYVHTVDAVQSAQRIAPHQPVEVDQSGVHQLPASLCELLNEHWRAVYTRTVNEQLHIVDALDTPSEIAMREYLDAQELREAKDTTSADFPDPGTSPDAAPGERLDPGSPPDRPPHERDDGNDLDR